MVGCVYGGNQCACWGGTWHCNPCPAGQPAENSSCSTIGHACNYGSNVACGCGWDNYGNDWRCLTCPGTKPADESGCADESAVCKYGSSHCRCRWVNWAWAMRWDCP